MGGFQVNSQIAVKHDETYLSTLPNGNAHYKVSLHQISPFADSFIAAIFKSQYLTWAIKTRHNT